MSPPGTSPHGPGGRSLAPATEDWEDWEDDEVLTPITASDGPLLGEPAEPQPPQRPSSLGPRSSVQRIRRLKSRHRQKAQNAQAGIKLVTDMTKFRQHQHAVHQLNSIPENRQSRTGKFVDAAALKALEGATPDDSVGAFGWMKRKPTKGKRVERLIAESSPQADLSPSAGPIMIGFAMPSDTDVVISPQTAVVETPMEFPLYFRPPKIDSPNQPTSAWSPDTEDGASPRGPDNAGLTGLTERAYGPPVPSVQRQHRGGSLSPLTASDSEDDVPPPKAARNHRDTATTPIYVSDDEDDMATPVTLFEEDGTTPVSAHPRSPRVRGRLRLGTAARSRSQGWWDQVTSPFGPPTPATPRTPGPSEEKPQESQWWKDADKKQALSPGLLKPKAESSSTPRSMPKSQHRPPPVIVIEDHSTPPSPASSQTSARAAKPPIDAEPGTVQTPGELPPPYSPPSQKHNVRYRAVFPPGHPLNNMYPPSPGPVPPGLAHTMTSQGAISLADVPLTPPPAHVRQTPLPDRQLGSFVPGDHFLNVPGNGPRQQAERRRRRHEKEDAVAYKASRRGGLSCCGMGRPGREGRKRRRMCLGVCIAILLLTVLAVVLGITLPRTSPEVVVPSRWLNLTDFPPMPTGISTVIGPESDTKTGCVQPPTLWTCALPKEQASSVAPFNADQPSFVFHIQFDNSTQRLWDVTGQETPSRAVATSVLSAGQKQTTPTPSPGATSGHGGASGAAARLRHFVHARDADPSSSLSIKPDPPRPSFQEMFFLGNTTDGVVSPDKAGEPTPFYISILRSINSTVGPDLLSRRDSRPASQQPNSSTSTSTSTTAGPALANPTDIAPPPVLESDGTGAAATLLGFPTQQPLRLYDRGLPTERYSFYSYYNKTTYIKSLAPLGGAAGDAAAAKPVPADLDGGALRSEANFVVTWLMVRYKVEIWTRRADATRLVGAAGRSATQPGPLPYPVTVTLDTHGGRQGAKFAFVRGVDERQRIRLDDAKFVLNAMNTTGDLANPAGRFDPGLGGMDGGTGGCRCECAGGAAMCRRYISNTSSTRRSLLTLAIETSCDDTCVAVLEQSGPAARLLFNKKTTSDNKAYGGVHPNTAVASHISQIGLLIREALQSLPETGPGPGPGHASLPVRHPQTRETTLRRLPDFVSATRGPGMLPCLSVGLSAAKGLAAAWQVPLLGVHHMQAHALTPRLVHALQQPWPSPPSPPPASPPPPGTVSPAFPFLTLLVSGGHTQLVLSRSLAAHAVLADKHNVAIGDMLDNWSLTPPLSTHGRAMAYDFSGLGGRVQSIMQAHSDGSAGAGGEAAAMGLGERRTLARAAMRLAFEHLASRVVFALEGMQKGEGPKGVGEIRTLVVAGGVASNQFLRRVLRDMLDARGFPGVEIVAPPVALCTDNAAMIGWAGLEMYEAGWESELDILPVRKWSFDPNQGGGVIELGGWRYRTPAGVDL
ncbi:hypothetical protein BT67DRAFT_385812 [Trichocladium antarcticum]|uniref:N(6)-L-threonylcarbamoyladenine synthase n=1 Tax=Trichocladium antarcticum TaxID=1450529 RepID=A0AAN6UGD6_9PEZI|nr:hypothetical protein BT67DRAFT_385812 [Trichocladium antarcticum]